MTRCLVLSDLWLPFPGGAERYIFNLARALDAEMDVLVLTGDHDAQAFDGPPVLASAIGIRDDHEQGWRRISQTIESFDPDVILTHHFYAHEFGDELAACGVPFVQLCYNGARNPAASFAVVISEWARDQIDGVLPTDLTLPPMALDDVIAPTHEHAIGMVKPLIDKGVGLVYDLAERFPTEQFVILRGLWQALETIRTDLKNVRFMEPVADIREFWAAVDLALVPSLQEDAGTVAQEATVNGLVCISSDVGGLAETNGGGIRLAPGDVDAWEASILYARGPSGVHLVESQAAAIDALGLTGRLASFVARVQAVARVRV